MFSVVLTEDRSPWALPTGTAAATAYTFRAGMARFFPTHKAIAKLHANAAVGMADYLLNGVLTQRQTRQVGGTFELINNLSGTITGEYRVTYNRMSNVLANDMSNHIIQNNHYLNLSLYAGKRHSLTAYNSYYGNNIDGQENQYFLDALYRYRVESWNTVIELSVLNLLGNNRYVQQFASDYQLVWSHFELRPRQFLVSTRFRF